MEENNICSQLHAMEKGDGIFLSPKPIVHPKKPADGGERNFIVINSCRYCNQWYHCYEVVSNYKHTFHPWCLGAMLKDTNKCNVCKQKLHLDWWSSWGICEANEEMELDQGMNLDVVRQDMVANVLEAAKSGLDLKSNGESKLNPNCNLLGLDHLVELFHCYALAIQIVSTHFNMFNHFYNFLFYLCN
jgi:uncharacterized CHY-type Zn-finger protein